METSDGTITLVASDNETLIVNRILGIGLIQL